MFTRGVPEKLIAEKTGHHSIKALRYYERTPQELEKAVDDVIAIPKNEFSVMETDLPVIDVPVVKTDDLSKGDDLPKEKKLPNPVCHTFTRNLSNCTINISYS